MTRQACTLRRCRISLAVVGFMLSFVALLAILAVAMDGYGFTWGVLAMLRARDGVTPWALLLFAFGTTVCPLCMWAGLSLLNSKPPA